MQADLIEIQNTAVSIIDFASDAGAGMEEADSSSFAIPFLKVLQGLSPELETIEGSRPGMLCNSITGECFKEVRVIPCAYQRRYIRWGDRASGGGFKGEYKAAEVESGTMAGASFSNGSWNIEGDKLNDTRNHFVLIFSEKSKTWQPALLSLSSTQIKKSKRWMTLIQGIEIRTPDGRTVNPASYSHEYLLKTIKEENSKGSWHSIDVTVIGNVKDISVYNKAKNFSESVRGGAVTTANATDNNEEEDF